MTTTKKKPSPRATTTDQTAVEAEPTPDLVADEPPGALGDRFAAAVRAVGDGATGERIEQILAG